MSDSIHSLVVTDANYETEVMQSSVPVLIDFWGEACGPCEAIAPAIEELASEYTGKAKVCKVKVNDNMDVSSTFRVRGVPTFVIVKDGKVLDKISGATTKAVLRQKLEAAL